MVAKGNPLPGDQPCNSIGGTFLFEYLKVTRRSFEDVSFLGEVSNVPFYISLYLWVQIQGLEENLCSNRI